MNLNKSLSLREIADTPVQVSAPPARLNHRRNAVGADEHREVYLLSYVGVTGFCMGLLYLVLHTWLNLSYVVVHVAMAAVAALLTVSFLIAFLTAKLPSAEQRFIARQRCGFWLVLTVGLLVAAAFAWLSRSPGWRGWLVSGLVFLGAAVVGTIASWLGYRISLNWFGPRARPDRRG